ncbi:MAG TPA: hypothetical protein VFB62_27670 [Polyangiaceae bacterium]|nr:hypothetical protein [Polyangiaceae bacterium]
MDLFLSAQSISMLLAIAGAWLVGAWWLQRWRARARMTAPSLRTYDRVDDLPVGELVTLRGVLRVDGTMCARFEDAHPVAATSYWQPPIRSGEDRSLRTWHACAERLYLDVAGTRVALDGPLVVAMGSTEWAIEGGLHRLRERVRDRVYAADVVARARRRGDGSDHVFRSLEPGDAVAISGIIERKVDADGPASYRRHGGGWRLASAEDEVLIARYRGRPEPSRRLGRVPFYAAAAGAGLAVLLASLVAGTHPTCSDHREQCALYGLCGTRLVRQGASLDVSCVPPSHEDCRQSLSCRKLGACSAAPWGACVAESNGDCRASLNCELYGRCTATSEGECAAISPADCARVDRCRRNGCDIKSGACVPLP